MELQLDPAVESGPQRQLSGFTRRIPHDHAQDPARQHDLPVVRGLARELLRERHAEGEGEAHYILQTGKAEAEKVRLMGEAQGVAYREQVNALGPQGVALVETLKVIGEKGVRITPDVMATGTGAEGGGGIGTLLLMNLFRDRLNIPGPNGEKAPTR